MEGTVANPTPDSALFEELLTPVLAPAYRTARHFTGNAADAEDAVQQASLLAWRAFGRFEAGTNFRAWFLRIVTNVCRSEYRRVRRAPNRLSLDDPDMGDAVLGAAVAEDLGPVPADVAYISELDTREIADALARLPEEYRTVCTLYFMEELAYQEIAEIIGRPVGTVRSRLHRGRRLLKQALLALAVERGLVSEPVGGVEREEEEVGVLVA